MVHKSKFWEAYNQTYFMLHILNFWGTQWYNLQIKLQSIAYSINYYITITSGFWGRGGGGLPRFDRIHFFCGGHFFFWLLYFNFLNSSIVYDHVLEPLWFLGFFTMKIKLRFRFWVPPVLKTHKVYLRFSFRFVPVLMVLI